MPPIFAVMIGVLLQTSCSEAMLRAHAAWAGWLSPADGIRLSLADEYDKIYIYNLRGNQRTAGELSRKEGGKVFGGGSRNTVAIMIAVKTAVSNTFDLKYRDIGDYLSRDDKLRIVADSTLANINWQTIEPNQHGDWINQRNDEFESWPVIGVKKATTGTTRVFTSFSAGLQTNRDAWVYNFAKSDRLVVESDGAERLVTELPLTGNYTHEGDSEDENAEWAVPVTWTHTVPREQAFWKNGMFANQNTAAKLRQKFTIEQVSEAFGLED